jgi:hypothetical protein
MLFRVFEYSNNENDAKVIFDDIINNIKDYITNKNYIKIEPYWKIKGIYVVEVKIQFNKNFNDIILKKFLMSIAYKWMEFGNPIDEVLASETMDECNYIKKDINMINIFY